MSSESTFAKYPVDVVFVIDCTGSMQPLIDNAKSVAQNFYDRLRFAMNKERKDIDTLRVRIIQFRDLEDGPSAIKQSRFFELPEQRDAFNEEVSTLYAHGGGGIPESGLEALWTAMRSTWRTSGNKRRHVIVLFTDAPAHELGVFPYQVEQDAEPTPKNLISLKMKWGDAVDPGVMDRKAKRLIIFAPNDQPWEEIGMNWEQTIYLESQAGEGLQDHEFDEILTRISATI